MNIILIIETIKMKLIIKYRIVNYLNNIIIWQLKINRWKSCIKSFILRIIIIKIKEVNIIDQ